MELQRPDNMYTSQHACVKFMENIVLGPCPYFYINSRRRIIFYYNTKERLGT